jgi:hypothetical protein
LQIVQAEREAERIARKERAKRALENRTKEDEDLMESRKKKEQNLKKQREKREQERRESKKARYNRSSIQTYMIYIENI